MPEITLPMQLPLQYLGNIIVKDYKYLPSMPFLKVNKGVKKDYHVTCHFPVHARFVCCTHNMDGYALEI